MKAYLVNVDYKLEEFIFYQLDGIYLTEESALKRVDRLHKKYPEAYVALAVEEIKGELRTSKESDS
mgnify:CR=1 FL=1